MNKYYKQAKKDVGTVIDLLKSGKLSIEDTFYAIEAIGATKSSIILPILLKYADHPIPIIREAVLYAASMNLTKKRYDLIKKTFMKDSNETIVSIAKDI